MTGMIMVMIIAAFLLITVLELLMFLPVVWRHRFAALLLLSAALPFTTLLMVVQQPGGIALLIALFTLGRFINYLRIGMGRMHAHYLYASASRTSRVFIVGQLLLVGMLTMGINPMPDTTSLTVLAGLQVAVALGIVFLTAVNLYRTRYKRGNTFYADRDLPTVSLLIPARNETYDLEECLRSALASDYPKLEIIVLDDCSHAQTSDIIKAFAHDGVRFVRGEEPSDRWLAKNHAYDTLAEEASGELLLFCGVDVRFGPHAIKALVTELLVRDKHMISVLPHRVSGSIAGAFIQPMRYWWELSVPRILFNRPAVLSTCWLIRRKTLDKLGNFDAVSHSIIPEGFFARELVKTNGYSFIRANDTLDVQTKKSYAEQRATALRTRYPQLRRRPENTLLLIGAELVMFIGPYVGLAHALVNNLQSLALLSAVATLLFTINHIVVVQFTSPANVAVALINFPVEVLTEVVIALMSMLKYEFGTVEWKDRNVCIPVMHVTPRLPRLRDN